MKARSLAAIVTGFLLMLASPSFAFKTVPHAVFEPHPTAIGEATSSGEQELGFATTISVSKTWLTASVETRFLCAEVGKTFTYTVRIENKGFDLQTVSFTEDLTTQVAFLSATPSQGSCEFKDDRWILCDIGAVADDGEATVAIKVFPIHNYDGHMYSTINVQESDTGIESGGGAFIQLDQCVTGPESWEGGVPGTTLSLDAKNAAILGAAHGLVSPGTEDEGDTPDAPETPESIDTPDMPQFEVPSDSGDPLPGEDDEDGIDDGIVDSQVPEDVPPDTDQTPEGDLESPSDVAGVPLGTPVAPDSGDFRSSDIGTPAVGQPTNEDSLPPEAFPAAGGGCSLIR